jgi:hypothetical protein
VAAGHTEETSESTVASLSIETRSDSWDLACFRYPLYMTSSHGWLPCSLVGKEFAAPLGN